jgi:hypothetical protein
MAPLVRLIPGSTTPDRAATVISGAALNPSGATGTYYDEKGNPMTTTPPRSRRQNGCSEFSQTAASLPIARQALKGGRMCAQGV